jgi:hypothetical protein
MVGDTSVADAPDLVDRIEEADDIEAHRPSGGQRALNMPGVRRLIAALPS